MALESIFALCRCVMLEQQKRFLDDRHQVEIRKGICFFARIIEEIGNDLIQPLRLAADDLDQLFIVIIEGCQPCQFLQGSGHGGQWLANFVGDGR